MEYREAVKTLNTKCRHFSFCDDSASCDAGMDMTYCTMNCPFATNAKGHLTIDSRGNVIGKSGKKY